MEEQGRGTWIPAVHPSLHCPSLARGDESMKVRPEQHHSSAAARNLQDIPKTPRGRSIATT
eukprot:729407-Hanusia_phi.AAC.2